jgi:mono/diheme cytochrome c family protein
LAPVRITVPENRMRFPFDQRWTLAFWNIFNNPDHRFRPDATRPEEWNRGAYLVEALGHCAQCHTPRNIMQGLSGRAYAGARQEGWLAYNLTGDPASGLGGWSDAALEQYLASGHAEGHGPASGPMAEAVQDSLRYLTPRDIHAMVVYLRTIPARSDGPQAVQAGAASASSSANPLGARIFIEACAGCHLPNGQGRQSPWAALAGDHSTGDASGTNLVQVLAHGTQIETDRGLMFMHAFTRSYTDPELAAVANYVVAQFGHRSGTITPEQIRAARGGPEQAVSSGLFGVPLPVWAAMVLVVVVLAATVVWLVLRGPPAPLSGTAGRS